MNKRTSALGLKRRCKGSFAATRLNEMCARAQMAQKRLYRRWRLSLASLSMRVKSERLPIMPLVQLVNVEDVLGLDVAIAFSTPNACRPSVSSGSVHSIGGSRKIA